MSNRLTQITPAGPLIGNHDPDTDELSFTGAPLAGGDSALAAMLRNYGNVLGATGTTLGGIGYDAYLCATRQ